MHVIERFANRKLELGRGSLTRAPSKERSLVRSCAVRILMNLPYADSSARS